MRVAQQIAYSVQETKLTAHLVLHPAHLLIKLNQFSIKTALNVMWVAILVTTITNQVVFHVVLDTIK